jgi:DNA modification methylase
MIQYSNIKEDLSTIEDYEDFLKEIDIAFDEMNRVLKKGRYMAIFVADYRVARSRIIIPLHADVIYLMQNKGFEMFDLYVWRYYRSGSFRPFGAKPYQAMNIHSYVLIFHKPKEKRMFLWNRPIRYRKTLISKINQNQQ